MRFARLSVTRDSHSFVGASWYYDYNIEHLFLSRACGEISWF